jgi:hypothetical protein
LFTAVPLLSPLYLATVGTEIVFVVLDLVFGLSGHLATHFALKFGARSVFIMCPCPVDFQPVLSIECLSASRALCFLISGVYVRLMYL